MHSLPVNSIYIGKIQPFGKDGKKSAIYKSPIIERVLITTNGIYGDEQADKTYHGGPNRAIHHYAADHYPEWRKISGYSSHLFQPASFGENISTIGMTEVNVCIGDYYRLGTALVQVSQPRAPCWKLSYRFGLADFSRRVQMEKRTGWFYRVLETGVLEAGDEIKLVDRICPAITVDNVLQGFYIDQLNMRFLQRIVALKPLSENWRAKAQKRINLGYIEDWTARLNG